MIKYTPIGCQVWDLGSQCSMPGELSLLQATGILGMYSTVVESRNRHSGVRALIDLNLSPIFAKPSNVDEPHPVTVHTRLQAFHFTFWFIFAITDIMMITPLHRFIFEDVDLDNVHHL